MKRSSWFTPALIAALFALGCGSGKQVPGPCFGQSGCRVLRAP